MAYVLAAVWFLAFLVWLLPHRGATARTVARQEGERVRRIAEERLRETR